MREWQRYIPAAVLCAGWLLLGAGTGQQRPTPLTAPLASLPRSLDDYRGADRTIGEEERRVAGMSAYLFRVFTGPAGSAFSVYVGYYDQQVQGRTIHSPKNCLPGAGWDVVASAEERLDTPAGPVPVNRYALVNGGRKAVVFYWYQGRGRVEANEYKVKLQLLRDAALRGRTEEALVRVVVPVETDDAAAAALGRRVSAALVPEIFRVLPT
jgi:EpsI family protein